MRIRAVFRRRSRPTRSVFTFLGHAPRRAMQNPLSTAISLAAAITVAAGFTPGAPAGRIAAPGAAIDSHDGSLLDPSPEYQAPRATDGHPDLNGICQAVDTPNWDIRAMRDGAGPCTGLGPR